MQPGTFSEQLSDLIAGRYAVEADRPMPMAGGGVPAFAAQDRYVADAPHVALAVTRHLAPRLWVTELLREPVENLMTPLAHGLAALPDRKGEGYFVICPSPLGPPLSTSRERWSDRALLECVLRPIAQILDLLHQNRLTHRAIRLNNVFQHAAGQPVMLGAAWAAPPAWHQPAIAEPVYSAMCHRAGRGAGTIADDVYALGALLLCLAAGAVPLADFSDAAIIRLKLEHGSFAAMTRDFMPSGFMSDLLRGMLADDPDHRPTPKLLLDTGALRGRRLAARPPRRSQRALRVNEVMASDSRTLAYALAADDRKSIQLLRNGQVSQWLRRDLGDAAMAAQVEELIRLRQTDAQTRSIGDSLLVMQVVSIINPRMPMTWRGVILWPDSLPVLVAEAVENARDLITVVEEMLTTDIVSIWSSLPAREGRGGSFALPSDILPFRQVLTNHVPGGLLRLFYILNPMLPCQAKQVANHWVTSVTELLARLEQTDLNGEGSLIDLPLAAFIAARGDRRCEPALTQLMTCKNPETFRLKEIELIRDLQLRHHPDPLPALAKWMMERLKPDVLLWQNRPRREALTRRLTDVARTGLLANLVTLIRDPAALAADHAAAQQARSELRQLEAILTSIEAHDSARFGYAERAGHAVAGGVGLGLLTLALLGALVP